MTAIILIALVVISVATSLSLDKMVEVNGSHPWRRRWGVTTIALGALSTYLLVQLALHGAAGTAVGYLAGVGSFVIYQTITLVSSAQKEVPVIVAVKSAEAVTLVSMAEPRKFRRDDIVTDGERDFMTFEGYLEGSNRVVASWDARPAEERVRAFKVYDEDALDLVST